MGLGGFILGGALSGVGAGLQKKVEDDVVARREARLEAMRQAERREDRQWRQEDQQTEITATAQRDARLNDYDMRKEGLRAANALTLAERAEKSGISAEQREEARQLRLEKFRTDENIRQTGAVERVKAEIAAGKIEDITYDDDGNVYAIYGNGRSVQVDGARSKKTQPKSSGRSLLGDNNPLSEVGEGAETPSAQTVTRADVEFSAQRYGMTYAQAKAKAEQMGMKVID